MSERTPHNAPRTFRRAAVTVLGLVALAAPPASARTLAPGPAAGRFLGGFTSQGRPIVVKVSSNGKSIQKVRTGLDLSCTSGDSFSHLDGWMGIPVSTGGRVAAAVAFPPSAASAGSSVSITGGIDSVNGKLNRSLGMFSGVWHIHVNFAMSNGQTDSCDSGNVTFTASL